MIERMVLFGASGDLTSRLLLPAVAQLAEDELLGVYRRISLMGAGWESGSCLGEIRDPTPRRPRGASV